MQEIPADLVAAIRAGDCVLWTGAGLGALAGRPGWATLLRELSSEADAEQSAELGALLERGSLLTVLDWVRRHRGEDALEAAVATKVDEDEAPAEALEALAGLRWRACIATTYPDLLVRAKQAAGQPRPRVSRDASKVMASGNVLHTPLGEELRRNHDLRELVEEIVRTSTLVLLGFEAGDPDLRQILAILTKIPATGGNRYLFLPSIGTIAAEQIHARSGLDVQTLPDADPKQGLEAMIGAIVTACGDEQTPSRAGERLAVLELSRVLRLVPPRVDLGVDAAFGVDPHEVDRLFASLPGGIESLPTRDVLRLGCVWLAHAQVSGKTQSRWHKRARKAFQHVVTRDRDVREQRIARFNLALLALVEGDEDAARTGLEAAAEQDRNLALVSARFALVTVRGRVGSRVWLDCHDRASDNELVTLEVGTLGRPVSPDERRRFTEQVEVLASLDHPALVPVRGGVAEGRVFGVIMKAEEGVPLSRLLAETAEPLALDKAFELIGPLMEVVDIAHAKDIVHRNLHPRHVLITQDGAKLRGFGFLPLVSWSRSAIVRENLGYGAPELFAGAAPSPASDTYALAAMLYRCVTGSLPLGSVPPPSTLVPGIDLRVDALLAEAMHPDPDKRPDPKSLRTQIATILTTPHKFDQVAPKAEAKPAEPAKPTGPIRIVEPDDPNDLEAWTWILERKPAHLPAREAVSRIEREARGAERWDRVADVLDIRARLSQAESEKIVLLRELAEISERRLGAPGNALEALLRLIDSISVNAQVPLVEELLRLAEVTGRWAAVANKLRAVGRRVPGAEDQLRILSRSAQIYLEQVGELDQAIAVYEDLLDLEPENISLQRAALVAYRKADRPAELATGLLTIAELETGAPRHDALIEAAQILGDLGEHEGALEAAEHVRSEDPDNLHALAASERWARELDRWDVLAQVLPARADAAGLDDAEASALRSEAAQIMREHLQDEAGAIAQYRKLVERGRADVATAQTLVELLRPKTEGDSGEAASAREGLIDALSFLIEKIEDTGRRAELLAEAATFLDREADGGERAADCRERIVSTMPVDHALVRDAVAGLIHYYRSQDANEPLAELLERRAKVVALPVEQRVDAYEQLYALASGVLADEQREQAALEALAELAPSVGRWRDLLIERLRDAGEQDRAEELLRERIASAESPEDRASMLVTVARMRERAGELEEAEARVREALELDETASRAWALLRDILDQRGRALEALDAQIRAAQTSTDSREKVRELFAAAKTWTETLNKPERALPLIREIVEIDPHHQGATGMLVERLVERGELDEAWPHAERWVAQTRASNPDERELNAHVHALAGRCALAVHNKDEARALLRDAKQFDPRNRDVGRALADLELESQNWEAALKAYQGLAIQGDGSDKTDIRAQAELYLRMGQARHGMGEGGKALQMIDRALDIDPTHVEAARFLVEIADGPARKVEARQRLIEVLAAELAKLDEQDERHAARTQELLDLRLELASTLADELNRPEEAAVQMRKIIDQRPRDISLLHRALELFSNAEQWDEAVGVLDRLAKLQDHGPIQAKYRYAAASLMRAHNLDVTGVVVRARLLGVLEADPLHDKAFAAVRESLEAAGDWRELSKVVRSRLKATPEDQVEVRVALVEGIAAIYERLGEQRTAMIAYEQAIALSRTLGANDDDERQTARRNKVISLSVQLGDDALDKGIEQVQALIRDNPLDYDSYHRLVELYLAAKQRDAAIVVSRTLRFLKQADEAEIDLAAELGENFQPPRGSISRKQWRDVILPNHPSSRLSDLYGLLWPVMAARAGLSHASAGVQRSQRESVTMQAAGVTRWIAYMAQVIDMPPPDLYLRKGEAGGFRVTALGDQKGVYPSLLAGDEALARQPDASLAFRAGRAIARSHPHLIGAALLPSASSLRDAIYGAVGLTQPKVAIPKDLRDAARGWAEAIKKMLPPSRLDDLRKAVAKVIEGGGADTKTWLRGCDLAAARTGFLVSDNIDVSARVILQGGVGVTADGRELIKGLIAFSVSGPYLELRRSLKIGR